MTDTDYAISAAQQSRLVSVHQRKLDGSLDAITSPDPPWREFWSGGGGLNSTARDYLAFLQMLLHQGQLNGVRLLRPDTVALMGKNQIGDINAGILKTANPQRSNDVDFFPGIPCKWGLGYMINTQPGRNGRGFCCRATGINVRILCPYARASLLAGKLPSRRRLAHRRHRKPR